jgi:hypothetical protein
LIGHVDGKKLPSDWYLRLGGMATRMLNGAMPLTPTVPLNSDGSPVTTLATPEPIVPSYRMRVQIATTSDWTTFGLASGGRWVDPVLVSASAEATNAGSQFPFSLNQAQARARAGGRVQMIVDVGLSGVSAGKNLTFEIKRGALGKTTITLMNYTGATPVVVKTVSWSGPVSGANPHKFTVPSDLFLPPKT